MHMTPFSFARSCAMMLTLALAASPSSAAITGNDWLRMYKEDSSAGSAYVMGALDSLQITLIALQSQIPSPASECAAVLPRCRCQRW